MAVFGKAGSAFPVFFLPPYARRPEGLLNSCNSERLTFSSFSSFRRAGSCVNRHPSSDPVTVKHMALRKAKQTTQNSNPERALVDA